MADKEHSSLPSDSADSKISSTVVASKSSKDLWDKIEIITRPIAALLTAILITIIGYFGQSTLTELSLQEQNARLYTELLARREDAESSLRKDMFKEVMGGFFSLNVSQNPENDLSKKVLKLELLAINFGDSLSLGPLFSEMSKDIERVLESNKEVMIDWKITAGAYQKRLRSLAKRVASSQLSTIFPTGSPFSFEVPMDIIEAQANSSDFNYTWPFDDPHANSDERNLIELEGIKREFQISFKNANYIEQSVQVKLVIFEFVNEETVNEDGKIEINEYPEKVTDLEFTLDFFNFPLIDNTRLSNNQRFTLILEKFDSNTIKLSAMVFPGLYASQRDKPFLNEAIQELGEQRGTNSTRQEGSTSNKHKEELR
jgi:hypothetical protein